MPLRSTADFTSTPEGSAFYRAYDAVLEKWPIDATGIDIESEYGTTRINTCGPIDSPPLLLLPGGGATSTVWFDNVAALADRHRIFAVDIMGDPGRSVADGTPIKGIDDLLSWLDAVVHAAGLTTFSLAAHSYGAMIALAYALSEPTRVRKLVLLDPNSCFAGMRPQYPARALPLLLRPTEKRQRDFLLWETGGRTISADWLDLVARGAAHFPKSRTIVPKRPKQNTLEELTVDTTLIFAAESKVHNSRQLVTDIAESLPRLRSTVIEGATHHTMPMSPTAELNEALIKALTPQ